MAKKMSKKLVALSSAAISIVYFAGYALTEPAARQIAAAEANALSTATPAAAASPAPQVQAPTGGRDQQGQQPGRPNGNAAPARPPFDTAPGRPGFDTRRPGFDTQRPGGSGPSGSAPSQAAPSPTPVPAGRPAQILPTPTAAPVQTAPVAYKDGVYTGHGTSQRGDIDVAITIQGGQISAADITHSTLQYPVSRISRLPGQVVTRQGAQVDNVTGSTLSARAFQDAVRMALAQAHA